METKKTEEAATMPRTVTDSVVALLPKKASEERPIALTSYAYRAWCRTRYPLHDRWLAQYRAISPWDRAIRGISSLEVAVMRILKGEVHRHTGKSSVTLLLDLKGFYENVDHVELVEKAMELGYPAILLQGALQLYQGHRHLVAENMVSPPLVATKGILAGCPLAPGLSKIVLHNVVEPLWHGPHQCHVDLYIDDTGYDLVHSSPKTCAHRAYQVWQEVKDRLQRAKLPLSVEKTAWICNNTKVQKELEKLLQETDPKIKAVHKLDSAGGRRRRVATHKARMDKGMQRSKRLQSLSPNPKAKIRACTQGVMSVALYGHAAMGMAPKRLKWVRQQHAIALGRMSLGSTELVLEMHIHKHADPTFTIMNQQLRLMHKLLVMCGDQPRAELESSFEYWSARIRAHPEPWRIVVGPVGAALCYAKALKWKCHSITSWEADGVRFDLTDRAQVQALSYLMGRAVDRWRWQAIQQAEEASSLGGGIDWQAPRRALKQCKGLEHTVLQAIWQGAIRHGKGAVCRRCDKPASLRHVLWDCSWWQTHCQEPEDFPRLRQENQDVSLWLRGLPGKVARPASYEFGIQETGVFEQQVVTDPGLRYATDGSPGASQDPRFQALTWGVIAFRVEGSDIVICGKATGPVPRQQTVFRAEAQALAYLVDKTEADLDVTLDCQGVQTNVSKAGPLWKAEDIFGRIRPHKDRLDIHWVNSHLDLPSFVKKFGAAAKWRWKANQEVDFLVQTRANEVRDLQWEAVMVKRDAVTCKVNRFLATRGAALLQYNETEGPLIEFGNGPNRATRPRPGVPRQPSGRVKQSAFSKRQSKLKKVPGDRNQATTTATPNKRRLLEEAVDNQHLGHQFTWTSRHQNGARIKCLICGLGAAQINKLELLQRILAQPCKGHDSPQLFAQFWRAHPSHVMSVDGMFWRCDRCRAPQHTGHSEVSKRLLKECPGVEPKVPPSKKKQTAN